MRLNPAQRRAAANRAAADAEELKEKLAASGVKSPVPPSPKQLMSPMKRPSQGKSPLERQDETIDESVRPPELKLLGTTYQKRRNASSLMKGGIFGRRTKMGGSAQDDNDDDWDSSSAKSDASDNVMSSAEIERHAASLVNDDAVYIDLGGAAPLRVGRIEAEIYTSDGSLNSVGPRSFEHLQIVFKDVGLYVLCKRREEPPRRRLERENHIRVDYDKYTLDIWDLSPTVSSSTLSSLNPEEPGRYNGPDRNSPFAYTSKSLIKTPILQFRAMRMLDWTYQKALESGRIALKRESNILGELKLMSFITMFMMIISGPNRDFGWNFISSYHAQLTISERFGYSSKYYPALGYKKMWFELSKKLGLTTGLDPRTVLTQVVESGGLGQFAMRTEDVDDVLVEAELLGPGQNLLQYDVLFDLLPPLEFWNANLKSENDDNVTGTRLLKSPILSRSVTFVSAFVMALSQFVPSFAVNNASDSRSLYPLAEPYFDFIGSLKPFKTLLDDSESVFLGSRDEFLDGKVRYDFLGPLGTFEMIVVDDGTLLSTFVLRERSMSGGRTNAWQVIDDTYPRDVVEEALLVKPIPQVIQEQEPNRVSPQDVPGSSAGRSAKLQPRTSGVNAKSPGRTIVVSRPSPGVSAKTNILGIPPVMRESFNTRSEIVQLPPAIPQPFAAPSAADDSDSDDSDYEPESESDSDESTSSSESDDSGSESDSDSHSPPAPIGGGMIPSPLKSGKSIGSKGRKSAGSRGSPSLNKDRDIQISTRAIEHLLDAISTTNLAQVTYHQTNIQISLRSAESLVMSSVL